MKPGDSEIQDYVEITVAVEKPSYETTVTVVVVRIQR